MGDGRVKMKCWEKYGTGCVRRRYVVEAKSKAKQRTAESIGRGSWLGSREAGRNDESDPPHEKEQEGEVAIAREEMHSRSDPVKGEITYRC